MGSVNAQVHGHEAALDRGFPVLKQKTAGAGGRERDAHRIWSKEDLGPTPWQHWWDSSKTSEIKVWEMPRL